MMRSLHAAKSPSGQLSEAICYPAYAPTSPRSHASQGAYLPAGLIMGLVTAIWYLVTLPFRLLIGLIAILGRMAGFILGFSLMVIGMALWAGPLFILGIPLFIVGVLLTLRCLC